MILRRFYQHIGEQNWFAVGLDILVVITGIFLGMQVSDWNESRKEKALADEMLVRLQGESEAIVGYWVDRIYSFDSAIENQIKFLSLMTAGSYETSDVEAINDALLRVSFYPAISPPNTVIKEITGSDKARLVAGTPVRAALTRYVTDLEYIKSQLDFFRAGIYAAQADAYHGRVFAEYDPDSPSMRKYRYDFLTLAEDEIFTSHMVNMVRDQVQFQRFRYGSLQAALNLCEAVSKAVGEVCYVPTADIDKIEAWDGVNN